jgi:hypothetical protein
MKLDHNIKIKPEKTTMWNSQPTKIIRNKLEKTNLKNKSNLKNIDLERKSIKFDTKIKPNHKVCNWKVISIKKKDKNN